MIMKKIFTLMALLAATLSMQAAITIYVQADEAPYLYVWNGADNGNWPGTQMTETAVVQGTTFWKKTFDGTGFNIIFNNGAGGQTEDITGITSDRYFTYDGNTGYTDVTTQYGGEIPDAVISTLQLAGNHTTPAWGEGAQSFSPVVDGKSYTITVDVADVTIEDNLWRFKLIANGGTWFGYSKVVLDAPSYLAQAPTDDNFELDLEATTVRKFTFTATWAGGKQAGENWTLKVEEAGGTGIQTINATVNQNAPRYDLSGRMVNEGYRGVVIQNGKKFVVK